MNRSSPHLPGCCRYALALLLTSSILGTLASCSRGESHTTTVTFHQPVQGNCEVLLSFEARWARQLDETVYYHITGPVCDEPLLWGQITPGETGKSIGFLPAGTYEFEACSSLNPDVIPQPKGSVTFGPPFNRRISVLTEGNPWFINLKTK